jgi:PilZ domain
MGSLPVFEWAPTIRNCMGLLPVYLQTRNLETIRALLLKKTPQFLRVRGPVRYKIGAPASFRWVAPNGRKGEGKGTSRDISVSGAFVFARKLPPVGANVRLSILLQGPATNGRLRHLEVNGQVVRSEIDWRRKVPCGFGVSGRTRILNMLRKDAAQVVH